MPVLFFISPIADISQIHAVTKAVLETDDTVFMISDRPTCVLQSHTHAEQYMSSQLPEQMDGSWSISSPNDFKDPCIVQYIAVLLLSLLFLKFTLKTTKCMPDYLHNFCVKHFLLKMCAKFK